jgi:transposase
VRARRQYVGEAQKEFVLKEVDKMHRAGKHPDDIAAVFGVTVRTAYTWLAELKASKGAEAKAIDPYRI